MLDDMHLHLYGKLMIILFALLAWCIISVITGIFVGAFIEAGRGE